MQLTHFQPHHRRLHRDDYIPRLMDDFFAPFSWAGRGTEGDFIPSVDIYEKENNVFFEVEVPGFKKEDLKVDVKGRIVTIRGEHLEEKTENRNTFRKERIYGKFERSFQLDFEADDVNAKYENGILIVEIPKAQASKAKQIEIR